MKVMKLFSFTYLYTLIYYKKELTWFEILQINIDSDGKLVNVGNFDSEGLNVNRWNPDNRNSDIGVCFSEVMENTIEKNLLYFFYPSS